MEFLLRQIEHMDLRFEAVSAVRLAVALFVGGLLAMYIRLLYRKCSTSASGSDFISGVFPMLTMATIAVIAVVKSSLALSLGLVGALSIVRFRAAIKDPEQLVYLFICIAVGLALGAEKFLIAVTLVFVASIFILARRFLSKSPSPQNLLVTIYGNEDSSFNDPETGALKVINDLLGNSYTIQRFEVEDKESILRIVVPKSPPAKTIKLITDLREKLSLCRVSFVNLDAAI